MKFNFNFKSFFYITHLLFRISLPLSISTHSHLKSTIHQQQQQPILTSLQMHVDSCPCAMNVQCPPCEEKMTVAKETSPLLACPCVKCPSCLSISLMHELSAKKAMHDQQATVNLKKMNDKIGKYFDVIMKSLSDVVNYEQEARDKAKLMEEASIKAMIARRKMIDMSEKARYIAKMGIVERKGCVEGEECSVNDDLYEGRVFPEEVSNINQEEEEETEIEISNTNTNNTNNNNSNINSNSNNNNNHIYHNNYNNYYKPNTKQFKVKYNYNNT